MSAPCIPLSWLELELHALGESSSPSEVEQHLDQCDRCRQAYARIVDDDRALPALEAPAQVDEAQPRRWWVLSKPWSALGWTVAPALAALLLVIWRSGTFESGAPSNKNYSYSAAGIKGGDVGLRLVRERAGELLDDRYFASGDRFKVFAICAPKDSPGTSPETSREAYADIMVLDGEGSTFPYPPHKIRCGNEVAVAGAFTLDGPAHAVGTVVQVCLLLEYGAPPSRETPANDVPCVRLQRQIQP